MTTSGVEITAVKSGIELVQAWQECKHGLPNPPAWAAAIEAGTNEVLVAHKEHAVGYVTIRWAGPLSQENEFAEAVAAQYPHEISPAVYALYVHPEYRRQGIARALMLSVEQYIQERPDTVQRAVLSVESKNNEAISLYRSLGYQTLKENLTVDVPRPDPEAEGGFVSELITAMALAKDLGNT